SRGAIASSADSRTSMTSRMRSSKKRRLAAILLVALYAPSASAQAKKVSTAEDARIYREAMVWFKKAEALIGTPQENGDEQAALFRKALEIKPDFLEAHYNLGLVYANQRKMKEAAEQFERSEEHTSELQSRFDLVC